MEKVKKRQTEMCRKEETRMEIYCDMGEFRREYQGEELPRRCPECGSLDLWFEKDEKWNSVCQLWAAWHGWPGQLNEDERRNCSIPEWYYRENKLDEWEKFKNRMTDPSVIGCPPFAIGENTVAIREKAIDYWLDKTEVIKMWISAVKSSGLPIRAEPEVAKELCWNRSLNIIRRLGENYLNHCGLGLPSIRKEDIPNIMS